MKRHAALVPLSHDHHHALVAAKRLRRAATRTTVEARTEAAQAFVAFFAADTARHFGEEEHLVCPLLAPDDPLVRRTLADHARLRELVAVLERDLARGSAPAESLERLGSQLEAHIRFEEQELFPAVEAKATTAELDELRSRLGMDSGPAPSD